MSIPPSITQSQENISAASASTAAPNGAQANAGNRAAGRGGRPGTGRVSPFFQLVAKLGGLFQKKPVALVRPGREVSFERIPFYDTRGSKLRIEGLGQGVRVRSGRKTTAASAVIQRELALSRNRGVAQAVPMFGTRAKRLIANTAELRRAILAGEIETPGNKGDLLRRKLEAMEEKEPKQMVDKEWLAAVGAHLARNRSAEGGGETLRALAASISGTKGGKAAKGGEAASSEGKGEAELPKPELADPRQRQVKPFQPQRIDKRTGLPLTEPQAERGKAAARPSVGGGKEEQSDPLKLLRGRAGQQAGKGEGSETISRITIERESKLPPNPGQDAERSRQLLKTLRNGPESAESSGTKSPAGAQSPVGKQNDAAEQEVEKMKLRGWHIGGDQEKKGEMKKARGGARSAVVEGLEARRGEAAAEGRTTPKAMGDSAAELARSGDSNSQLSAKAVSPPSPSGSASSAPAQTHAGQQSSGQEAARQMQNLQEVLKRMETNARVLTSDGRTTLQVRLKPASLGSVFVQIERSEGRYGITLRTSSEQGSRAVERQLPMIREHLAQQGIQVDRIEIEQQRSSDREAPQFADQQAQAEQERGARRRGRRPEEASARFTLGSAGEQGSGAERSRPSRLELGTNTMETTI